MRRGIGTTQSGQARNVKKPGEKAKKKVAFRIRKELVAENNLHSSS